GPLGAAGDLWTVWRLINLPIDYNPPRRTRWLVLASAALRSRAGLPVRRDTQTLLRSFPGVAGLEAEDAAEIEDSCAERISELLPDAITLASSGRCEE